MRDKVCQINVSVQTDDFDVASLYQSLRDGHDDGAVVTFVGLVRDFNQDRQVSGLFLEHYPGMTEKALRDIANEARTRWPVNRVIIIHRIGQLDLGEQIVFVGVTSAHREAAFAGCEFVIDYLKTRAPFWKKETTSEGERWVEAKLSDTQKAAKWSS